MKRPSVILAVTILSIFRASVVKAQQVTCTPTVGSALCKQFDLSFGPASLWPAVNFVKGVEIVIVDPAQFKAERAKWDAQKDLVSKNAKMVRDINHATGREAGGGMFDHEILECPSSSMVKRIVISTDAVGESQYSSISELSNQLLFYVIGYDQGLLQGEANLVP
jgi:hypothetical protein